MLVCIFPPDEYWAVSSCACRPFVHLFWRKVCSGPSASFFTGWFFCCRRYAVLTYPQFLLSPHRPRVNLRTPYSWHTLGLCPEGNGTLPGTGHPGRHTAGIIGVLVGFTVCRGEVAVTHAGSRVGPGSAGSVFSQGFLLQDAGSRACVGAGGPPASGMR